MSGMEVSRRGAVVIARPVDDIDAANADEVRMQLAATLDERTAALVLDLGSTGYIDSAGIDMLFRLATLLADRRTELRVVIPEGSHLRRVAEIVALPSAMPVDAGVEEAVAAAGRARGDVPASDPSQ
jgi:anti-anti-sigma factor